MRAHTVIQMGGAPKELHLQSSEREPRRDISMLMQLPGPSLKFTDREDLLAWFTALWDGTRETQATQVSLVLGPAGIGKDAAVTYWANWRRDEFPGGILYVDWDPALQDRAPEGEGAADVTQTLGEVLRHLGVAAEQMVSSLAGRKGQYLTLTSSRPAMLVIIVHATHRQQVEALIPRAPGSLVLVTTDRPELGSLRDQGASLFTLRGLDEASAVELFTKFCAPTRAVEGGPTVADLVRWCEGRPNAVLVLAKRLADTPDLSFAKVAAELASAKSRLSALTHFDQDVAAPLTVSYDRLPASARRLYRLLGVMPLRSFTAEVAALLLDGDADPDADGAEARLDKARRRLDRDLVGGFLLERQPGDRYALGELTGPHAALMAELDEHAERREAALYEILRHYLIRAAQADRAVMGTRARAARLDDLLADRSEPFADPDPKARRAAGLGWLDAERANFVPLLKAAARGGWHEEAWQLAEALMAYYFNRRPLGDWVVAAGIGIEAARHCGNAEAEARLRLGVSRAYTDLGHIARAGEEVDRAGALAANTSDEALQGSVWEFRGRYLSAEEPDKALDAFDRAYQLNLSAAEPRGAALAQYFASGVLVRLGRPVAALERLAQARQAFADLDDTRMAGRTLLAASEAWAALGMTTDAIAALEAAATELHGLHYEAQALELLARVFQQAGDPASARLRLAEAIALYRAVGHPRAGELASGLAADPPDPGQPNDGEPGSEVPDAN